MSLMKALSTGLRRMLGSPSIIVCLWLANLAVALPATAWIIRSLERAIGHSRVQHSLRQGFDMTWFREYQAGASGLEETFRPDLTGAGAFYANLEAWLTGDILRNPLTLVLGGVFALAWICVLGGAIDRYAHPGEAGVRRLLDRARRYFFRFCRLAALSAALYVLVYLTGRWMFERVEEAVRDVTVEGTVLLYSLIVWGGTALLLTLIHVVFDYAKIATVVEDRRSVLLAVLRGASFVLLHPVRTLGLYYALLLIAGVWLALFDLVGPGVGQSSRQAVIWAFVVAQLFLLIRLGIRMTMFAGGTVLFQSLTRPAATAPADDAELTVPEADGEMLSVD